VITIAPSISLKLQQRHTHTYTHNRASSKHRSTACRHLHTTTRQRSHSQLHNTSYGDDQQLSKRDHNADAEAATSTGNFRKHELPPRKATLLYTYAERSTGSITSTLPCRRFVAAIHGSHPQTLQKRHRKPHAVRNTNTAASTQRVPFHYYSYLILTFDIKRGQSVVLLQCRCQRCCTVSTNVVACNIVSSSTTC
jgi:hypothetical protein